MLSSDPLGKRQLARGLINTDSCFVRLQGFHSDVFSCLKRLPQCSTRCAPCLRQALPKPRRSSWLLGSKIVEFLWKTPRRTSCSCRMRRDCSRSRRSDFFSYLRKTPVRLPIPGVAGRSSLTSLRPFRNSQQRLGTANSMTTDTVSVRHSFSTSLPVLTQKRIARFRKNRNPKVGERIHCVRSSLSL